MTLTEEQAKTKLCCGPSDAGYRLIIAGVVGDRRYCAGSTCMAWRWAGVEFECHTTRSADGEPVMPDGDGWQLIDTYKDDYSIPRYCADWRRPNPQREGYCGLAGKP